MPVKSNIWMLANSLRNFAVAVSLSKVNCCEHQLLEHFGRKPLMPKWHVRTHFGMVSRLNRQSPRGTKTWVAPMLELESAQGEKLFTTVPIPHLLKTCQPNFLSRTCMYSTHIPLYSALILWDLSGCYFDGYKIRNDGCSMDLGRCSEVVPNALWETPFDFL